MIAVDLDSTLRAHGLRVTAQRRHILTALRALGHGTPEQVFEHLRSEAPTVNLSTVYRTIERLEELGLVSHSHLGHGAPTYHEVEHGDHIHLVCRRCGWVGEASTEHVRSLAAEVSAGCGFTADVGHLTLDGLCAPCREAGA